MTFPHYPYHFYFDDPDKELRRYSVGVFTIWLGYWNTGCSFRFFKQSELYKYIKALVEYQDEIEKEFPVSFSFIVHFLIELIENNRYSEEINHMKPYIIEIVNKDFLSRINDREEYIEGLNFSDFLKELKVREYDEPYK